MKILSSLLVILFSLVFAQGLPNNSSANPIVGVWQISIPLNDGGPPVQGTLTVNPNGTYREELLQSGQVAAFWEGTYTFSPDGSFVQTETNVSPQICMQGQCQPNDPPTVTRGRVSFPNPNTMIVAYQTAESGQQESLTWQRANGQATIPQANPQIPSAQPGTNTANFPQQACTPQAGCWSGQFSDGDISLSLGNPGSDYLERGDTRFPLTLQSNGQALEGSFSSNGSDFPVRLEPNGAGIILISGELRFELVPLGSTNPAQPSNPLGN
ncbi:MAG: hypothetical protein KC422_22625 [Trueperaceae bacterium]|nr:hypothetical protein [Trueperaceae bacterium]